MRKVALSFGVAAVFIALGRFLFTPVFSGEGTSGTAGLLLAAGLFTIAIAAVVPK